MESKEGATATGMRRVYLDHTATTPLDPRVLESMLPYFSETFGNASSIHALGRDAKQALERSRESIAQAIGAKPGEVFFTSGGTESNNLALRGVVSAARKGAGQVQVLTTQAEHHAVLEPCQLLEADGHEVTFLPVDVHAVVSADQVNAALRSKPALVSVMTANNEVGSLSPLAEIGDVCRSRGALLHSDAVQALGKIPVNVDSLHVDLMSISAHKIYGPKGIGALYIRQGTALEAVSKGGGQERGKRPGTESVPLAVGFARAVDIALEKMTEESSRLAALRDHLETMILSEFPDAIVNGHPSARLPHILSISFDSQKISIEGELLVVNMDLDGIAVASGSACTSGSIQPSHVIMAMGRDRATARATIRFSFGKGNTMEDVDMALAALKRVISRMKKS